MTHLKAHLFMIGRHNHGSFASMFDDNEGDTNSDWRQLAVSPNGNCYFFKLL